MLKAIKQYSWAIALIFLVACGPVIPISPSPTSELTFTPIPTNTIYPSPQSTLTATLTLTPAPTGTNWPLGMEIPIVEATPTSIATPDLGTAEYRLKDWNEGAALGLVNVAEQYSYADNVGYFGDDRFNYITDQVAVRVAALEVLKRYPDAEFKEKLEWRVSLANAMLGNQESDAWILQQVEDGLNSGRYTLDKLDVALNPYGFQIGVGEVVKNLLGRGQPGQLLFVSVTERPRTSLYAALGRNDQSGYKLVKIHNSWGFNRVMDDGFDIGDHTADGLPEVILSQENWNGSYCGSETLIFQWQEDAFAELSQGQFYFDTCNEAPGYWKYGAADVSGAQTIEVHEAVGYTSTITRSIKYRWNGKSYQLAESLVDKPETLNRQSAEWVGLAMDEGSYALLRTELPRFLSTPGKVDNSGIGPSYRDYLRFQLSLAYVLNGERSKARATLQQIIEKPDNLTIKTIPDAAKAYLQNYNGQADVYRACQETLLVMNKAAAGHIYDWGLGKGDQFVIDTWGYDPGQLGYSSTRALCSLDNAFRQLVKNLEPAQFEQAPDKLRDAGVRLRSAEMIDLDGDGQADWLLLVDTPGDDAALEMWILLNSPEKISAVSVTPEDRKKYDLPWKDTDGLRLEAKTVPVPDGTPISFLKLGTDLFTFQLNAGDTAIQLPYIPDEVESYTTRQNGEQLEIEITHTPDSTGQSSKDVYSWSTYKTEWINVNDTDWDLIHAEQAEAEAALLIRWQPDEAILLLQKIPEKQFYGEAYCQYLLGLAYELKGNEKMAVQTYLNLWQNHADTVYARLVQEKLEPIK